MESDAPYKYRKTMPRLPRNASYACARGDVDACLAALNVGPPFHELILGWWRLPDPIRRGVTPPVVEIATAIHSYRSLPSQYDDFRRVTRTLYVRIVPRDIAGPVRDALRRDGLTTLMRWLEARRTQTETANVSNYALHLEFAVQTGELRTREGRTPAGSRESP